MLDALTGAGTFRGGYAAVMIPVTVGAANGSGTFSGTIVTNISGPGGLSLTKAGTGTQVLAGANT